MEPSNSNQPVSPNQVISPSQPAKASTGKRVRAWVRELLAIAIWSYAVVKVWVYDLDILLVKKLAPNLIWVIEYKFFIIVGLTAAALLIVRNATAVGWAAYIFFYPFVVCGKVVYIIFRQRSWLLGLACVNVAVSFFRSFKNNFLLGAGFALCWVIALVAHNRPASLASVWALLVLLAVTYARAFFMVFRPSNIFRLYQKVTKKIPGFVTKTLSDKAADAGFTVSRMTGQQLQAYRTSLQTMVIWNRSLLLLSRKLEKYLKSGFNTVAYVLSVLFLTTLCLVSFAAMSYAVYKAEPGAFLVTGQPSFFLFLYHSVRTFMSGSIPEITAAATLSRVLVMTELGFAVITLTLLVTLLFSVKKEKYNQGLTETIQDLKAAGKDVEGLMVKQYKMTTEEAIREIEKMTNNAMNIIMWLTQNMR
jgi:acetolactate synthase regulatory subunit